MASPHSSFRFCTRKSVATAALLLLLLSFSCLVATVEGGNFQPGVISKEVITLTSQNLDAAIKDSANPLWFLKFYAPWCGHCKKMAPILDKVAPFVSGKLAIGKIDCTVEKKICDQYEVRGYPSLKFAMDGEIYDYPGGRSADDIIDFAEKLAENDVKTVFSIDAAMELIVPANVKENKIVFLAHDPNTKGKDMDEKLQSTTFAQLVSQVARKYKISGSFALLDPPPTVAAEGEEVPEAPLGAVFGQSGAFFCRLEQDVETRCLDVTTKEPTISDMVEFYKSQNIPTISFLGPHNFNKMGRSGRLLAIAVVDPEFSEQLTTAQTELRRFALSGEPKELREKYYFGWFDGKTYFKFLEQFNVDSSELPQMFALDVANKLYWQNATYKLNVDDFLAAIEDGTLSPQSAGKKGLQGYIDKFMDAMIKYRPFSMVILIFVLVLLGIGIFNVICPGSDEYQQFTEPDGTRSVLFQQERAKLLQNVDLVGVDGQVNIKFKKEKEERVAKLTDGEKKTESDSKEEATKVEETKPADDDETKKDK